ncbi:MAG TPA: hypothetical protein VFW75_05975 [Acetobacteraceae bacterium]|nr:hypothetical protein [Acetobacteraceae bacterium]
MALTGAYRGGYEGRPGWWISTGYVREEVEALKQAVPHTERAWDPDAKRWWIAIEYEGTILQIWPAFAAYQAQAPLL